MRGGINVYASEVHRGPRGHGFRGGARIAEKPDHPGAWNTTHRAHPPLPYKARRAGELTEELARDLMLKHSDNVHVARKEDLRLNSLGLRSKLMESQWDRWKLAGIAF